MKSHSLKSYPATVFLDQGPHKDHYVELDTSFCGIQETAQSEGDAFETLAETLEKMAAELRELAHKAREQ